MIFHDGGCTHKIHPALGLIMKLFGKCVWLITKKFMSHHYLDVALSNESVRYHPPVKSFALCLGNRADTQKASLVENLREVETDQSRNLEVLHIMRGILINTNIFILIWWCHCSDMLILVRVWWTFFLTCDWENDIVRHFSRWRGQVSCRTSLSEKDINGPYQDILRPMKDDSLGSCKGATGPTPARIIPEIGTFWL